MHGNKFRWENKNYTLPTRSGRTITFSLAASHSIFIRIPQIRKRNSSFLQSITWSISSFFIPKILPINLNTSGRLFFGVWKCPTKRFLIRTLQNKGSLLYSLLLWNSQYYNIDAFIPHTLSQFPIVQIKKSSMRN